MVMNLPLAYADDFCFLSVPFFIRLTTRLSALKRIGMGWASGAWGIPPSIQRIQLDVLARILYDGI